MQKIVLFNGGREGSILIAENGTRTLPPFNIPVQKQLKGVAELVQSLYLDGTIENNEEELLTLVNRVANLVVEEVESIIGPLEAEYSLIYQDDDGGFTCGSTGKLPIPLSWPPDQTPSVGDLVSNGLLEQEMLDYIDKATAKEIGIQEILETPEEISAQLGVQLSQKAITDLKKIAPSQIDNVENEEDREVIKFVHNVLEDGRFVDTWMTKPFEAAKGLEVELSDKAYDRILAGSAGTSIDRIGSVANPAVAVVVAVVVMLVPTDAGITQLSVFDRSGLRKF
ncbi:MAG: hypothetical protein AAF734_01745 [Bacteroidota bacterium]